MLELVNRTAWQAGLFPGWGLDRRHQLTLVVKQSFAFGLDGQLTPLAHGPAIEPADRRYDDPVTSSLAAAGEAVPFKQGGELLIFGTAQPARSELRVMEVEAALDSPTGLRWRKTLRVFGRRVWQRRLLGAAFSYPQPLEPLPLRYEYAFGGIDKARRALDERNPSGLGFARRGKVAPQQPLPQIEQGPRFIKSPGDQPAPAGFAPLPSSWAPRSADFLGFNEDGGLCPYPQPVPPTLYNCAPLDQRFAAFKGDERLSLRGFFAQTEDAVELPLPRLPPAAFCLINGQRAPLPLQCDTLVVRADDQELDLVWRGAIAWSLADDRSGHVLVREQVQQEVA
jgi:hypothetical protein